MDIFAKNQPFYFGEDIYNAGGRYGPHERSYLTVFAMRKGNAKVIVDGVVKIVTTGYTGLTHNKHLLDFHYYGDNGVRINWCVTGELVGAKESIQLLKTLPLSVPTPKRILDLMKIGINIGYSEETNISRVRNAIGEAVVYEYFNQANLIEKNESIPASVTNAKHYIDQYFSDVENVDSISKKVRMNPVYLSRLFKKFYGKTISEYIWQLRAEKSAYLLCNSGMTSKEIAYQSGYKNEHHFSRHIKNIYGHSPRELRQRSEYQHYHNDEANKMDTKY